MAEARACCDYACSVAVLAERAVVVHNRVHQQKYLPFPRIRRYVFEEVSRW
jgi:hypothetical protein